MDCWFNVWKLEIDYPFFKEIMSFYGSFESSIIGLPLYFHLFSFALVVSYADPLFYLWVHFSFIISWTIWYLLIFFASKKIRFWRKNINAKALDGDQY
jgi:hypothetical protein